MLEIHHSDISLTRGDTAKFDLTITNFDGQVYERQQGDRLVFTIKKSYNSEYEYIQKEIDGLSFVMSSKDTQEMDYGNYWYDVQLETVDKGVYTVLGPARFIVRKEVSF